MITKMSAKQRSDDYLIEKIDKAVNELVFNKWKLQKAYNYYNGKRDAEQFRYLVKIKKQSQRLLDRRS